MERKRVQLRASSLSALKQLVHHTPLDLDCGGPRRQLDGTVTITAFVTNVDIVSIRQSVGVEVVDVRDVDHSRQSEVGSGDRFAAGRIAPRSFSRSRGGKS